MIALQSILRSDLFNLEQTNGPLEPTENKINKYKISDKDWRFWPE